MTAISTQIVVDGETMEYELQKVRPSVPLFKVPSNDAKREERSFQVIHDCRRPPSSSLCILKSVPSVPLQPVEPMPEESFTTPERVSLNKII